MAEKKFLIVDDELSWRIIIRRTLDRLQTGLEIVEVDSVEGAKSELLADNGFTDLVVDGMKGKCTDVIEYAKGRGVNRITLLSADDRSGQANDLGVSFIDKSYFDENKEKLLK